VTWFNTVEVEVNVTVFVCVCVCVFLDLLQQSGGTMLDMYVHSCGRITQIS